MHPVVHILEIALVCLAPALLLWDVVWGYMWDVKPYLVLWAVCLSVVFLMRI